MKCLIFIISFPMFQELGNVWNLFDYLDLTLLSYHIKFLALLLLHYQNHFCAVLGIFLCGRIILEKTTIWSGKEKRQTAKPFLPTSHMSFFTKTNWCCFFVRKGRFKKKKNAEFSALFKTHPTHSQSAEKKIIFKQK